MSRCFWFLFRPDAIYLIMKCLKRTFVKPMPVHNSSSRRQISYSSLCGTLFWVKNGQSKPKRAGQFDGSDSRNLGDQKQGHPYYNLAGKGEAGAISVSLNFTFKFRKCFFTLSNNSDVTWHDPPPPAPRLPDLVYRKVLL